MYRKAATEQALTLVNGVDKGLFAPKAMMETEVFQRVCAGILASRHTPKKLKKYYRTQAGVP